MKVSLIIPGWNCETTLGGCLDSVLAQTLRDFEVIFVNDGSTDGTGKIVEARREKFAAAGIPFRVVEQENSGQAAALNAALPLVRGEYLVQLDADDLFLPDNLKAKAEYLDCHSMIGMVRCNGVIRDASGIKPDCEIIPVEQRRTEDIFAALFREKTAVFSGCYMMRMDLFDQCWPDRAIPACREGQNLQMLLPAASRTQCGFIDRILFVYMARPDSHSHRRRSFSELRRRNDEFYRLRLEILEHCRCDRKKFRQIAADIHRKNFCAIARSGVAAARNERHKLRLKAGIATFINADNYGAALQAYALSRALQKCGIAAEFLPTSPGGGGIPRRNGIPAPMRKILERREPAGKSRHRLFEEFRRAHLSIAPGDSAEWTERFDLFIAGSDQVWNPQITGGDRIYFLPFAPADRRCSYAASFGGAVPTGRPLADFRHVSLREESGLATAKALGATAAEIHPDPVFLLDPEEYLALTGSAPASEKYLLTYYISYNPELQKYASELAARNGWKIRMVCAEWILQFGDAGLEAWSSVGVPEFLRLAAHAECIVGNSFHASAFAMIFHRKFRFFPLTGDLAPRNGRVRELEKRLGVTFDGGEYDYGAVSRSIAEWRNSAFDYFHRLKTEYRR